MASGLGTLTLWITADNVGLKKGFLDSEREMAKWKTKAIAGATVASAAISAFAYSSIKAFMEQEQAANDLSAAIENNGGSALRALPHLQALASQIQKLTVYDDDAIVSAMAFGKNLGIETNQLDAAARAAVGLAAKFRIDLQTAMQMLGMASQGNTSRLKRYGITIDENLSSQEKFNQLLKIGAANFGLAERAAGTTSGRLQQMKNSWGDFKESMGETIINTLELNNKIQGLTGFLQAANKEVTGISPALKEMAVYAGAAAVGITGIAVALKGASFLGITGGIIGLAKILAAYVISGTAATVATEGLGWQVMLLAGSGAKAALVMGGIASAVALAAAAVGNLIGRLEVVRNYLADTELVKWMGGVNEALAKDAEVDAKIHKFNQEKERAKKEIAIEAAKAAEAEAAPVNFGQVRGSSGKYGDPKQYQNMEDDFRQKQKDAMESFEKKRKDAIFDAMTNEQKINELYKRRQEIAAALNGYVGAEKVEKMGDLADIESQMRRLKSEKAKDSMRTESSIVEAVKKGSIEALRIESARTDKDTVADNTKETAEWTKKTYEAIKALGNGGSIIEYEKAV